MMLLLRRTLVQLVLYGSFFISRKENKGAKTQSLHNALRLNFLCFFA
jgi:hypothetical protein